MTEYIDNTGIKARIQNCQTYNFGMRAANKLAHEDAPALIRRIEELEMTQETQDMKYRELVIEMRARELHHFETEIESEKLQAVLREAARIMNTPLGVGYMKMKDTAEVIDLFDKVAFRTRRMRDLLSPWT